MNEGSRLRSALGGLQAGVLGVLGMLGVFLVAALATHRPYWLVPNLLATAFHGADAFTAGFTRSTLTGMGFLMVLYGLLGAGWGLLWGDRPIRRLWLGGAIAGYLVYLVFEKLIWKNTAPLVTVYAPEMQMRFAHVVWGLALGQSPRYAGRMSGVETPAPVVISPEHSRPEHSTEAPPREEPPPLPDIN